MSWILLYIQLGNVCRILEKHKGTFSHIDWKKVSVDENHYMCSLCLLRGNLWLDISRLGFCLLNVILWCNKQIPANLDWFGWCTWDAFYTEVSPKGIIEGLQRYYTKTIQISVIICLKFERWSLHWRSLFTYVCISHCSLSAGGCPARFLIIDDGWQDTVNEFLKEGELLKDGVQ